MGIAVGEDVHAVQAVDHPALAARVARQPRVAAGMDGARDHGIAGSEARPRPRLPHHVLRPARIERDASGQGAGERRRGRGVGPRGEERDPRLHLRLGHDALFHEQARDAVQPLLVVGGREIVGRAHALDGVAELVDVVEAPPRAGPHHGEHLRLPGRVEHGLLVLPLHPAEALHPTEVVDPVHGSLLFIRAPTLPRADGHIVRQRTG